MTKKTTKQKSFPLEQMRMMLVQPVQAQRNVPVHQAIRVHHAKVSWLLVLLFAIKTTENFRTRLVITSPI